MENKEFKAALFDLDGVVFDTEPQYSIFWGGQFRRYYPEHPGMEQLIKGMTLVEIYEKYFQDKDIQERITRELDEFEQTMDFVYVKGFENYVKSLRGRGVKTAVVTSSNMAKMENVYRKRPEFKTYFDAILTSEDFAESKPSPDCYQRAAQRFGLTKDECVVFEDSFNGLKSGRAAGMYVVGLATTNSPESIAPFADRVIMEYVEM
ncbi:HAD family phosphatase [uncultured Prevotella sp.]|uniref:HAD family hydrolase n=1 Tax=uncultured Prevotella sp. TaxID=159272 RepID=UPI00261FE0C4|nr:HAD family phosphatase [uncultured Prevotella sp.]